MAQSVIRDVIMYYMPLNSRNKKKLFSKIILNIVKIVQNDKTYNVIDREK